MALPNPRPTGLTDRDERARRARLLDEFDALRQRIRERNPDLTEDDWSALADEWSQAVDDGLRRRVRRLRDDVADDAAR